MATSNPECKELLESLTNEYTYTKNVYNVTYINILENQRANTCKNEALQYLHKNQDRHDDRGPFAGTISVQNSRTERLVIGV